MCFSTPKVQAPPPPPPPVTLDDARSSMELRDRRRRAATSGSQSTFLTGSQGAAPPYGQKTLLGQ